MDAQGTTIIGLDRLDCPSARAISASSRSAWIDIGKARYRSITRKASGFERMSSSFWVIVRRVMVHPFVWGGKFPEVARGAHYKGPVGPLRMCVTRRRRKSHPRRYGKSVLRVRYRRRAFLLRGRGKDGWQRPAQGNHCLRRCKHLPSF